MPYIRDPRTEKREFITDAALAEMTDDEKRRMGLDPTAFPTHPEKPAKKTAAKKTASKPRKRAATKKAATTKKTTAKKAPSKKESK